MFIFDYINLGLLSDYILNWFSFSYMCGVNDDLTLIYAMVCENKNKNKDRVTGL